MLSIQARQIKSALEADPSKRESFIEWYHQFRRQLDEQTQEEVAFLLGLSPEQARPLSDVPFRELVPEGWFADLLEAVHQSESPASFYYLAALTMVGSLIGRKVMIDRGNHEVGVESSALLISPAGRGRRSTACDFVIYGLGLDAGLQVAADSFSYEHFGDTLKAYQRERGEPKALIYAGEMSALLGKHSYGESIIPKLTDMLWKTTRFQWGTVKRGTVTFERPCISALMTTAPDWLVENIPAVAFGGGLLSRMIVCVEEGAEKFVTWGDPIPTSKMNKLKAGLLKIGQAKGTFPRPVGEAYEFYDTWYQENGRMIRKGELPDERMAPYFSRKHDHLLKITAANTIAAGEPLVFTTKRMQEALRILNKLELGIPKAYQSMALGPIAAAQFAVVKVLERCSGGTMDHSNLHRRVYRQIPLASQFREVMSSLVELGVVQATKGFSGRGTLYILKGSLGG